MSGLLICFDADLLRLSSCKYISARRIAMNFGFILLWFYF
ncbi:hypothetical protein SynMVIR181_00463 [Synechococcus sp. MVIR-18-1]|nr:hypothetical protein SynMVIR181_00463 [Synechococcus sp. MVIR-18-1]